MFGVGSVSEVFVKQELRLPARNGCIHAGQCAATGSLVCLRSIAAIALPSAVFVQCLIKELKLAMVQIKEGGAKAGVVLNPGTSLSTIEEVSISHASSHTVSECAQATFELLR